MDTLCSVIARSRCGPVLDDKGRCATWQWSPGRRCISPAQCSLFWWSVTLQTCSSSFQNLLSDWNSAKVEAALCLCAGPPPLLKDSKDSYLAHGIVCRACLCVRSPFFFFFFCIVIFSSYFGYDHNLQKEGKTVLTHVKKFRFLLCACFIVTIVYNMNRDVVSIYCIKTNEYNK